VRELVVSLGYACSVAPAPAVSFTAADDVFRLERKRLAHKDRRSAVAPTTTAQRSIVDVRRTVSVPVRCVTVDNDAHLYLAGRSMIPTHNSTAAMDFSRAAAVRHNMASAIFSLEMSKVEIVMRLLAAESRVPLHVLRSGQLSDDDWTKLARRMGEISEAPLFVDDTPNMTLMEIRAKARRLRQRNDLKLIVVDYLQLMTSPKRVESRQQEVAELSRGLKLLAKEVECPVVAVSQLNRGPEQRTDKRPQLADLRESGCLPASTRIVRADTNAETTLGELFASGARDIPVWALNERLQYVKASMSHAFSTGRRAVFRISLASGKQIDATSNHRFLTFDGWRPVAELEVGTRLATARHLPAPSKPTAWPQDEVVLLANLIGDGSFVHHQSIGYAGRDEKNLPTVAAAAAHCRLARGRRNPVAEWLDNLGLLGRRSHEKFVPAAVFALPRSQVALFLRHLWSTDGSVTVNAHGRGGRVYYTSTSQRLVEDVSLLLLRFGIATRLQVVRPATARAQYTLDISGRDDQLRFLREIGVHGDREATCVRLAAALESTGSNPNVDTVPAEVWRRVRAALLERGMSYREFVHGRECLARVAGVLDSAELELVATNDVYWDQIVDIEPRGTEDVFDATVPGLHNFIANGLATHNSIEQDADVVILLHRDDYYDKESPRAGEADFIVAKHRNGPTDTITVAAQLHLSRFVDMAVV
jgi:replicative DNA helicase